MNGKNILFLLIFVVLFVGCKKNIQQQNNIVNTCFDDEENYLFKEKNIKNYSGEVFNFGELTFRTLECEGIDFINIKDMYNIMSVIDNKLNIYNLQKQSIDEIFDVKNNKINIKIKRDEIVDHRYLIGADAYKDYEVVYNTSQGYNYNFSVNLYDFKVEYINYNDEVYFPIMLSNYCFFDTSILLYPHNEVEYHVTVTNDIEINKLIQDIYTNNITLTKIQKEFTYLYLTNYLKTFYPYYDIKKENIEPIINEIEKNIKNIGEDDFNAYLFKLIDAFRDYHTSLINTKGNLINYSFKDLQPNRYFYMSSQNNEKFKSSMFEKSNYKNINNNIDYVYFDGFELENTRFISTMMGKLFNSNNKKKALIIDLRYNFGGYSTLASNILKYLGNDILNIYYTYMTPSYIADNQKISLKKINTTEKKYETIVLLTNEYTYSAANNFACWFKELNAGIIIGEKTGGGGSSVTTHVLPDGNILNASSSLLVYTDSQGKPIEMGVDPDIYAEDKFENGGDYILEKAVNYIYEQLKFE